MRHTLSARLIVLLAAGALLPAVANAQATATASSATASNTVTVRIPTVLRMQLTANSARTSSDVTFTATAGGQLDPASVTVKVFSNVTWSLSVTDSGGVGSRLQVHGGRLAGWATVTGTGVKLIDGAGATGGWAPYDFDFRPEGGAILDSAFNRTLTFTLARP